MSAVAIRLAAARADHHGVVEQRRPVAGERDRGRRRAAAGEAGRRLVGRGVLREDPHDHVGRAHEPHADHRLLARLERDRLPDAHTVDGGVQVLGDGQRPLADRARIALPRQQQDGGDLGPDRRLPGEPPSPTAPAKKRGTQAPSTRCWSAKRAPSLELRAPGLDDHGDRAPPPARALHGGTTTSSSVVLPATTSAGTPSKVTDAAGLEARPFHVHEVAGDTVGRLDRGDERQPAEVELRRRRAATVGRDDHRVLAARRSLQLRHLEAHGLEARSSRRSRPARPR